MHDIRKVFHQQLKLLWSEHPTLLQIEKDGSSVDMYVGGDEIVNMKHVVTSDGFRWLPMVTQANGLVCKLDILMLRGGPPGDVMYDMDNRLKTLFDALRMPKGPDELGAQTSRGQAGPADGEDPFYVLLEDDKLITHVSVTTDTMLQPFENVSPTDAVRLVISATVRPYKVHMDNLGFV